MRRCWDSLRLGAYIVEEGVSGAIAEDGVDRPGAAAALVGEALPSRGSEAGGVTAVAGGTSGSAVDITLVVAAGTRGLGQERGTEVAGAGNEDTLTA